ncbi:hypothetical protein EYF80_026302 [Liparis tanakae]|uniref:Uncharacterized protein n=1 Tax=Liparis tanakae TaxID=230148 RepID=A0A4Z2HF85_9TELE|nr:hypothetical protein EYF80_026302 [Liparis tanakae]
MQSKGQEKTAILASFIDVTSPSASFLNTMPWSMEDAVVWIVDSPQACAMRLPRKSSLPYCLLMTAVRMREVTSLTSWRFSAEEHTQSDRMSSVFLHAFS